MRHTLVQFAFVVTLFSSFRFAHAALDPSGSLSGSVGDVPSAGQRGEDAKQPNWVWKRSLGKKHKSSKVLRKDWSWHGLASRDVFEDRSTKPYNAKQSTASKGDGDGDHGDGNDPSKQKNDHKASLHHWNWAKVSSSQTKSNSKSDDVKVSGSKTNRSVKQTTKNDIARRRAQSSHKPDDADHHKWLWSKVKAGNEDDAPSKRSFESNKWGWHRGGAHVQPVERREDSAGMLPMKRSFPVSKTTWNWHHHHVQRDTAPKQYSNWNWHSQARRGALDDMKGDVN